MEIQGYNNKDTLKIQKTFGMENNKPLVTLSNIKCKINKNSYSLKRKHTGNAMKNITN